jgi:glycosyltransferase involved in cell wall biosynthesis
MARIAQHLGLSMLMFAPESKHGDARGVAHKIRQMVPQAEIVFEFLPQEEIATRLSECAVTCWFYKAHSIQSGISGSVRLGLAAGRPIVISRCGMYRDTFHYEDEIYFVPSDTPTFENALPVVQEALKGEKCPNRIIKDMSWQRCGRLYDEIYRKLLGGNE